MELRKIYRKISPFQMITISFFFVILLGSLLLHMQISQTGTDEVSYLDAVFTSCSAVCVTGLVVHNTATCWTFCGKVIILGLIQIGGLGVITVIMAASIITGKKIGIRQRNLMQNAINAPKIGGIIRFTRFILLFTFGIELLGTLLLAIPFISTYGFSGGALKAVFHSVSAFCNAGFDLFGDPTEYASLTVFHSNVFVNLVIMLLIVIGGLGFLTWEELITNRFRPKKLQFQTKLILATSGALILFPALFFFLFEFRTENIGTRLLESFFQSVTTRTAGFNTADIGSMRESSLFLMILLMMIGGSPGSTAGGIKTTTFAVTVIATICYISRKKSFSAFERSIPSQVIWEAFSLFILYLALLLAGSVTLNLLEGLPMISCMFECASALGTVGLTTGITPGLGTASKIILIAFMYFGRVGGLTLAYATLSRGKANLGKLPEAKIMIG